jgi:hypothetical protein
VHLEQPPVNADRFDVPHDPLALLHVPPMTVITVIGGHTVIAILSYSHNHTHSAIRATFSAAKFSINFDDASV